MINVIHILLVFFFRGHRASSSAEAMVVSASSNALAALSKEAGRNRDAVAVSLSL